MSASWALVRFNRTGNVYYACYEGTSDTVPPFIFTAEECYDEKLDCYCAITYSREKFANESWIFPDNVDDLDEVEIYSDYGGGFYWKDHGSESLRRLKLAINEWGELKLENEKYGVPNWVIDFFKKMDIKYDEWLERRGDSDD